MAKVKADFRSEWIDILRTELVRVGFAPPQGASAEDICHRYFNVLHRTVSRAPRKVEKAKGFNPPPEFSPVVDAIAQKFEKGQDIRPHLSKSMAEPDYDDDLLNDWGINHLHLGTKIGPSGFVDRTGPVLFVRIERDKVLFLEVAQHGQWANQHFVEILHANWPQVMSRYRLHGVIDLFPVPTDEDVKALRKGHVCALLRVADGTVYAPPGGGLATSGIGAEVVEASDYYLHMVRKLEEWLRSDTDRFTNAIKEAKLKLVDELEFKLELNKGNLVAHELHSGMGFVLVKGLPLLD